MQGRLLSSTGQFPGAPPSAFPSSYRPHSGLRVLAALFLRRKLALSASARRSSRDLLLSPETALPADPDALPGSSPEAWSLGSFSLMSRCSIDWFLLFIKPASGCKARWRSCPAICSRLFSSAERTLLSPPPSPNQSSTCRSGHLPISTRGTNGAMSGDFEGGAGIRRNGVRLPESPREKNPNHCLRPPGSCGKSALIPVGTANRAKHLRPEPRAFQPSPFDAPPSSQGRARCCRSSGVEHSLGKGEVESSNLSGSTISTP